MTYAVLSIPAAKRLAKAFERARLALAVIGLHLAEAGVQTLAESTKPKAKGKPGRKPGGKSGRPAKAEKAPEADPLAT